MPLLFFEIVGWLIVAAALGLTAGWLFWARELDRVRTYYRAKVESAKSNWEDVEGRLTFALEELRVLRSELAECRRGVSAQAGSGEPMEELASDAPAAVSVGDSLAADPRVESRRSEPASPCPPG